MQKKAGVLGPPEIEFINPAYINMENFNFLLIGQLSQSNPAVAGFFIWGIVGRLFIIRKMVLLN